MPKLLVHATAVALIVAAIPVLAIDTQRPADVQKRGAQVTPSGPESTTRFTKTDSGGSQRETAKNAADKQQIWLVRQHLRALMTQFNSGDFSGPARAHGAKMPGLARLKTAKPGAIVVSYQNVQAGAKLTYVTSDSELVTALHTWFGAQQKDPGSDTTSGHAPVTKHK